RKHRDRGDRTGVVGDVGEQQRLDGMQRHRVCVAEGDVDGSAHTTRGTGEIKGDIVALHVDLHNVIAGAVEALYLNVVVVVALAELADFSTHGRLRLPADGARQIVQVIEAVFVHEGQQLAPSGRVGGNLGHNVAHHLFRHAHVGANDLDDHLVEPTLLVELADREAKALVVDLNGRGTKPRPANIRQMRDAQCVGDDTTL